MSDDDWRILSEFAEPVAPRRVEDVETLGDASVDASDPSVATSNPPLDGPPQRVADVNVTPELDLFFRWVVTWLRVAIAIAGLVAFATWLVASVVDFVSAGPAPGPGF